MMTFSAALDVKDIFAQVGSSEQFHDVAELLLSSYLVICGVEYKICEIEFYLYNDMHPDPYVHCEPEQLSCGEWYFHRAARASLSFSIKGVDLTFGDNSTYGGVLIRGIEGVEGPSKVVDAILRAANVESVLELKGLPEYTSCADSCELIQISLCAPDDSLVMYNGPRVGLKQNNRDPQAAYLHANYRFCTFACKGKKSLQRVA